MTSTYGRFFTEMTSTYGRFSTAMTSTYGRFSTAPSPLRVVTIHGKRRGLIALTY